MHQTTPALYAIKLVETLRARQIDPRQALREAGFTISEISERDQPLRLDKYLKLVAHATRRAGIADLGFLVGEHTGMLDHGVLGYALLSNRSLSESLARYVRYQGLVGPLLNISLQRSGDVASMTAVPIMDPTTLGPAVLRYFIQEWLATWAPWSRLIGKTGSFFTQVTVGLPDQEYADAYRRHLKCPVAFEEHWQTVAEFPAANLDLSLSYSDETIGALCREQCELLLKAQRLRHGLTAEVHRQLAKAPGQTLDMEAMSTRLSMTSRTLRRHLLAEGTTFQDIVISHRIAMARRYLAETELTASEIADLVGYSDTANFFRMFRRVVGLTPVQFRQADRPLDRNLL